MSLLNAVLQLTLRTYQAEIVPAALRGFTVCSLQLFLNSGGLLATGVNKAFSKDTTARGWKTVTGIQFVFPVLITAFVPLIPDSPRWLLSKDRQGDALRSLNRLRTRDEVSSGASAEELALIEAQLKTRVHKASWADCFRGTNARRTWLVIAFYIYQQITGQAFVSTYQTVFFKENGYADHAFTYPVISSCLSVLAVLPCMYFSDVLGRRTVLIGSFFFQALWLCLLAGIGERSNKTQSMKAACVAFFMLFAVSYSVCKAYRLFFQLTSARRSPRAISARSGTAEPFSAREDVNDRHHGQCRVRLRNELLYPLHAEGAVVPSRLDLWWHLNIGARVHLPFPPGNKESDP